MYLPWNDPIPGRFDLEVSRLAWLSAWFNSRTFGLECFSGAPPLDRFKIGGSVTVSRISCTVSAFPVFIPLASKWWVAVTDLKPGLLGLMVGTKMVGLMLGAKMVGVVVAVGAKMGAPSLSTPKKPSMLLRLAIAQLCLCQRTQYIFLGSITDMKLWNLDSHFSCWWLFQFKRFLVLPLFAFVISKICCSVCLLLLYSADARCLLL